MTTPKENSSLIRRLLDGLGLCYFGVAYYGFFPIAFLAGWPVAVALIVPVGVVLCVNAWRAPVHVPAPPPPSPAAVRRILWAVRGAVWLGMAALGMAIGFAL